MLRTIIIISVVGILLTIFLVLFLTGVILKSKNESPSTENFRRWGSDTAEEIPLNDDSSNFGGLTTIILNPEDTAMIKRGLVSFCLDDPEMEEDREDISECIEVIDEHVPNVSNLLNKQLAEIKNINTNMKVNETFNDYKQRLKREFRKAYAPYNPSDGIDCEDDPDHELCVDYIPGDDNDPVRIISYIVLGYKNGYFEWMPIPIMVLLCEVVRKASLIASITDDQSNWETSNNKIISANIVTFEYYCGCVDCVLAPSICADETISWINFNSIVPVTKLVYWEVDLTNHVPISPRVDHSSTPHPGFSKEYLQDMTNMGGEDGAITQMEKGILLACGL
jgi:hypothetical protein